MPDTKMEIEEVADVVTQMLADNKARTDLYGKIDDAVGCNFTPDAAVSQLPFVQGRAFALTDIADARNAGTRVFTSLLPNISIAPMTENEGEYERTDKMEQAWKWELERMNRPSNGAKGIHDQIVESAVTYHAVALQTEYLPYKFKSRTPATDRRIRAMLSRKCFNWTVHHPGTVHRVTSDYGLEHVAKVAEYSALTLMEKYGKDNPGVMQIRQEHATAKRADLMKLRYTLIDYTNWTHRVQMAYSNNAMSGKTKIVFMNEEHGLPFIPWVIVDHGDPLWQAVLDSGHWNNLQHMKLIKFAKAVAMGMSPAFAIQTTDGTLKGVWLDYTNPLNPMVLPPGAQKLDMRPNQLDQQFETEYQEDRQDVARSTVARILQDPTPFLNAPFSTFNASITTALGQLSPAKRTAEAAEAEAIYQGFQWIEHSKIPFTGYRKRGGDSKIEGESPYQRGQQIVITPEKPPAEAEFAKMSEEEQALVSQKVYFDLDSLYVAVDLQSANITDEQARLNTYLLAKRELGMSEKEVWERMGWDGFEANMSQSATETLFNAEVQKAVQAKMMELQEQFAQRQRAMEEAAQANAAKDGQAQNAQNQINEMNAGSQMESLQGTDMRSGGQPAAMTAPNENQLSIQGNSNGQAKVV